MEDITTPREKILKKVRAALLNKFASQFPDADYEREVFTYEDEEAVVNFAAKFTGNGGGFIYCHNFFDFTENLISLTERRGWKQLLCPESGLKKELDTLGLPVSDDLTDPSSVNVAITGCEGLVGRTGAVMLSSRQSSPLIPFYSQVHLILARMSSVAKDMKEGLVNLRNKYGEFSPGELVYVHGPGKQIDGARHISRSPNGPSEVIVFLVNDKNPTEFV